MIPTVKDVSVFELLKCYKALKCRQIMKLLLSHELIMSYSDCKDTEIEQLAQDVKEKSIAEALLKSKIKSKIQPYQDESKDDDNIEEVNDVPTMQSAGSQEDEYDRIKPKRFTESGEYMK